MSESKWYSKPSVIIGGSLIASSVVIATAWYNAASESAYAKAEQSCYDTLLKTEKGQTGDYNFVYNRQTTFLNGSNGCYLAAK